MHLLTAIGLSPGGSSTVHTYTQTIHRKTQITTTRNMEECGPRPVFASFTLAFCLTTVTMYTASLELTLRWAGFEGKKNGMQLIGSTQHQITLNTINK